MENSIRQNGQISNEINAVVKKLADMFCPQVIYLYNQRVSATGDATSFKLCVVAAYTDKQDAERRAYLEIDCEIPFDLLLYTPAEWAEIVQRQGSFAGKIKNTGKILYGKAI